MKALGKSIPIREKRLHTISAYLGQTETLLKELQQQEVKQRIRTFSQATDDDVISVLRVLSRIEDVAIVIHGPRGCSASPLYFDHVSEQKHHWVVSNLNERDTIMGGDDSLRRAIVKLHNSHHPKVIVIVTTPVAAINNDDVFSVVEELRNDLGVLIVPVYADGFKSKTGVTGYDTLLHALLKYFPIQQDNRAKENNLVNVLSVTENRRDLEEITRSIEALGLTVNVLPQGLKNFARAAQAKVSISVNADYCDYLGQVLVEKYEVPFLQLPSPIGIRRTQAWFAALGKSVDLSSQAQAFHDNEMKWLKGQHANDQLSQVKVYVNLPTASAWGVVELTEELGAQVIGITVPHIDQLHQTLLSEFTEKYLNISFHVAQGQVFEQANLLKRLKPDVYIGRAADAIWAAKLGIATVAIDHLPILGYRGAVALAHEVKKALSNQAFVQNLYSNISLPYQSQWYGKSPNWHIKVEVK